MSGDSFIHQCAVSNYYISATVLGTRETVKEAEER